MFMYKIEKLMFVRRYFFVGVGAGPDLGVVDDVAPCV